MVLGVFGEFPRARPRRLRMSGGLRELSAETRLHPSMLMLPVFVDERLDGPRPIPSLPGHSYYPPRHEALAELIGRAMDLGVRSFLLFGVPRLKDARASRAYASDGPVQEALRFIRRELGWEPVLAADLCICGYSDHGHCGVPVRCRRGTCIGNDETLEIYRRIAVSQAEAGADIVAPSGMMDGQVRAIREALEGEGYADVAIMSYSVKYASSFYGPFRDVMDSAPRFGDRSTYQMDPRNAWEALKEAALDIEEGADIIMVKPALPYLDVVRLVSEAFPHVPVAAYNVSGEYRMVYEAVRSGHLPRSAVLEVLTSIVRAGARIVITYHALEAASLLAG